MLRRAGTWWPGRRRHPRHRRGGGGAVAFLAACAIGALAAPAADAVVPGSNGRILFDASVGGDFEIFSIEPDGTGAVRLTTSPGFDFYPAWSPDASRIAFMSERGGNRDIWVMHADGSDPRRLTSHPAQDYSPAWSPDGRRIAFVSTRDGGDIEVYVMEADGTAQTRLTFSPGDDDSPSWAPDGRKIAFRSRRGGVEDIYVMNPDGTSPANLTNDSEGNVYTSWSPDGTTIAFTRSEAGGEHVYVMDADGTDPRRIASGRHAVFSPDGSKLAFQRTGAVYTIGVDGSGETLLSSGYTFAGEPDWGTVPSPPSFVTRTGTGLQLGGQPYRPVGLNVYNANSNGWCWYAMDGSILSDSLTAMGAGKNTIRAWFFQQLATTDGTRDWTAFDRTLATARAHGYKVVATLVDQWGDCGVSTVAGYGYKDKTWYESAYKQPDASIPVSYRDWVAEVVTRYRDDPTILAWQLVNEPEVLHQAWGDCGLVPESTALEVLSAFAGDVAGLIKSIDPNHLVSLGTIGSGQCGAQGDDYKTLMSIPTLDLCEYHDYTASQLVPGDQWNGLQRRIEQCNELGKPLLVGELGVRPADVGGTLEARADVVDWKACAQFRAGVAGLMVWAWNRGGSLLDNFDVGPGDPLLGRLAPWSDPSHDCAGPAGDVNANGIADPVDAVGGPAPAFDDRTGTSGAIVDNPAALTVSVADAPAPDGVVVTVGSDGDTEAAWVGLTVCGGLALDVREGSEVVVTCGSLTARVVTGEAQVSLGGGLTVVGIPAGAVAYVAESTEADDEYVVENRGSVSLTLTVDGVQGSVAPGASLSIRVWRFEGFASPVENGGVLNVVKAGQAVPLKWRLTDAGGVPVTDLAAASTRVASVACSAGTGSDPVDEYAAGGSGLQNLGDGYYQLNWATSRSYAGSCKRLSLDIGDGVTHDALFAFTR